MGLFVNPLENRLLNSSINLYKVIYTCWTLHNQEIMVLLTEQVSNTIMKLEQAFISKISSHLLHYRFNGGETHQLCCPYCQSSGINSKDKKISASKAKGYFYQKKGATNFISHGCGARMQFHPLYERFCARTDKNCLEPQYL